MAKEYGEYSAEGNVFPIKDDIALSYIDTVKILQLLQRKIVTIGIEHRSTNKVYIDFYEAFYGLVIETENYINEKYDSKEKGEPVTKITDYVKNPDGDKQRMIAAFIKYKLYMKMSGLLEFGKTTQSFRAGIVRT